LGELSDRPRLPRCIDSHLATDIVRKVGKKYRPKSIMTFGGEPLLYPRTVSAIHKEAMEVGIPSREIITNGYWSKNAEEVQKVANNLVESGVNDVAISVDCFHQEFIPLDIVKISAESLLRAGMSNIRWNPCWTVCRDHENPFDRRTKAILEELKVLPIKEDEGNKVQPEGRAVSWLKGFFPPRKGIPKGKCGDLPYTERPDRTSSISVEPDGEISICKDFSIGNAYRSDIIEILKNYDPFKIP
jgi:MoaA/NifB/PqqE/SkfB family radical SAM enzyme